MRVRFFHGESPLGDDAMDLPEVPRGGDVMYLRPAGADQGEGIRTFVVRSVCWDLTGEPLALVTLVTLAEWKQEIRDALR